MLNPLSITLLASVQVTANGSGASIDGAASAVEGGAIGQPRQLAAVVVDVSAVAAGSLRLFVESSDNGTSWEASSGGSMLIDAAEVTRWSVYGLRRYVRIRYESSGADVTLTVSAKLHQTYATPEDFRMRSVLGQLDTDEDLLWRHMAAASLEAAGFLASTMSLPLLDWGDDLRGPVIDIAQFNVLTAIGHDPANAANEVALIRKEAAIATLRNISMGRYQLTAVQDQTPDLDEGGVAVYSEPLRGW